MTLKEARATLGQVQARLRTTLASIPTHRAMTTEEKAKLDALEKQIEDLKAVIEAFKASGSDLDDETEGEVMGMARTAPAVHTRRHRYSITRAIRKVSEPRGKLDGMEKEISDEIRRTGQREFRGQFTTPIDPPEHLRRLMYPNYVQRTDLTTSTGTGGIFQTPEYPLIELLRGKMVLGKLGATFLTDLPNKVAIPRASGQSSVQWVAEGSAATADAPSLDSVPLTPNVAVDITNVSRLFLVENAVKGESFVINQAMRNVAVALDLVGINGQGAMSNQPTGLLQNSSIQAVSSGLALGTNGGAVAYSNLTALEETVSVANADINNLGWLASPQLRNTMRKTQKLSGGTAGVYLWEDGPELGVDKMLNRRAEATSLCPSTLTKGSATNLSALVYGDWSSLIVGTFHGIDWLVNPFNGQNSAAVLISVFLAADVNVMHAASFACLYDCQAA